MDQAFLDMILLLISGDLEDLSIPPLSLDSPLSPASPAPPPSKNEDHIVGLVLSKRKLVTRVEIWLSGGKESPPTPEYVKTIEAIFRREFGGFKFYGYQPFKT